MEKARNVIPLVEILSSHTLLLIVLVLNFKIFKHAPALCRERILLKRVTEEDEEEG